MNDSVDTVAKSTAVITTLPPLAVSGIRSLSVAGTDPRSFPAAVAGAGPRVTVAVTVGSADAPWIDQQTPVSSMIMMS